MRHRIIGINNKGLGFYDRWSFVAILHATLLTFTCKVYIYIHIHYNLITHIDGMIMWNKVFYLIKYLGIANVIV